MISDILAADVSIDNNPLESDVVVAGRAIEQPYRFSQDLVVLSNPGSARAESIGALRTHLLAQHVRDRRRSLTLCGPAAGVGCTYIATNLACAFSLAGMNTLLIDANMRVPGVELLIRPTEDGVGLKQCLGKDPPSFGEAIRHGVLPNLSILYSGGAATNAQELLAGSAFKNIVDSCVRDFDITLIDTPPSNSGADARRVAAMLRYALIVARRNVTFVSDIKQLAHELETDRASVVGTFLNDF